MSQEVFVTMALNAWNGQLKRATGTFESLTDEQLMQEVAPGRNRAVYLMGHLIATHDALLTLLRLGGRLHPELDEIFITHPDNVNTKMPGAQELRQYWQEVHNKLAEHFKALTPAQWLERHNAMTDEDWVKEPHRNRMSVLIGRTNHIAYHLGQLVLIKK